MWCVTFDRCRWEWSQTGQRIGRCQRFWGNRPPSLAHWYSHLFPHSLQLCLCLCLFFLCQQKNFPKMFPHCYRRPPEAKSLLHKGPQCSGDLFHKRFLVELQHLGIWKEGKRERNSNNFWHLRLNWCRHQMASHVLAFSPLVMEDMMVNAKWRMELCW